MIFLPTSLCSQLINGGFWVHKEALDKFALKCNGRMCGIGMARYPPFFIAIVFWAVRGAILNILNKINGADFFKSTRGKNPH
jgi:hypothetical protein